jgi:hypothetical protein
MAHRIRSLQFGIWSDPDEGKPPADAPPTTEKRTVPARLRTLNQLLEDGLITEAEFNELRRKILAEL